MAIALILRLGDTTGSDISLVSSGCMTRDYAMRGPDVDEQALQNVPAPDLPDITESIELLISGSASVISAKTTAIERLLNLAPLGKDGITVERLYLVVQFDQDSEAWRSQILSAKLDYDDGTNEIWRGNIKATIVLTRRYFWETEALQSVAMTSGVTTLTSSYVTVYNSDDAHPTHRNWFQMTADRIAGSIPAPAKISIKNTTGADRSLSSVYIGNYVFAAPTTVDPILRGEDAAGGDTTPGTTETEINYWNLVDGNLVSSFNGQFGRYVVVWSDRPNSTTLLRAAYQLHFPAFVDVALGEQMLSVQPEFVMDLGALPIPPGGYVSGAGAGNYVAVKGKAASGTDSVAIDWLQIFPSGAGLYRVLKGVASLNMGTNDEVVDDGPLGKVYGLSGGVPTSVFRPLFTPIYLWPGKINRLRMIISSGLFSFEPDYAWGVKVETRFRRLTF